MKIAHRFSISTAALLLGLGTMPALAQETGSNVVVTDTSGTAANTAPVTNAPNTTIDSAVSGVTQGNVNAENSIEQSLKSGSLTSEEAARLQAHQARIDQIESHDLQNGALSTNEQNRIGTAENREDNRITALENNNVTADPTSQASERMANDVQRNINQQNHIVQGVSNGQLTNTEVSNLENGRARASAMEGKVGNDGNITNGEQNRMRIVENFSRDDIRQARQNGTTITGGTNANVTTNNNVTTQGTPAAATTNVSATAPAATNSNVQTAPTVNGGSTAAVQAGPATVVNGTAVHAAPAAAVHAGHR